MSRRPSGKAQFARRNELTEQNAWEAHEAMLMTERARPYLKDNPYWRQLRKEAYADLCMAMGGEP